MFFDRPTLISREQALPGRPDPILVTPAFHDVLGSELHRVPEGCEVAYFALGCFWGAEKLFWELPGVHSTAVGYQGGFTPNPTYEEVCSGRTGHAETVRVVFRPTTISYAELLGAFFENHDPTQGFRQGNDVGTQYRSALFITSNDQLMAAHQLRDRFQEELSARGFGAITTEITDADTFYFAEEYHQQYGSKMERQGRAWYCPLHATGVTCNPPAAQ